MSLHVPWHKLRELNCSTIMPFSSLLNVLHQTPLLEKSYLDICGIGTDRLKPVTLPNLRSFVIILREVHPDTVIPFISALKVTELVIYSFDAWSADTYNTIKKQFKLNQLQKLELYPSEQFPLYVTEVLKDVPMIHDLYLGGKSILDDETRENITSGQLGRFLTYLTLYGCCDDKAKEWLDMVEARQKNAYALLQTSTNWQERLTGLRWVKFCGVKNNAAYRKRLATSTAALKLLGVDVILRPQNI